MEKNSSRKKPQRPRPASRAISPQDNLLGGSVNELAEAMGANVVTDGEKLPTSTLVADETVIRFGKANNMAALESGVIVVTSPVNKKNFAHLKQLLYAKSLEVKVIVSTKDIIDFLYQDHESNSSDHDESLRNEEYEVDDSAAINLLDRIIDSGYRRGASDIHIIIRESKTLIENRVDSRIILIDTISRGMGISVCSVAFGVFAKKDFSILKNEQGSFTRETKQIVHRMRINSQYLVDGSEVVLRFNGSRSKQSREGDNIPSFSELGLGRLHQKILLESIQRAQGLVLITGPTGSGKTTTLASAITTIPNHLKVYTVEDPVEKILPNASQVSISSDAEAQDDLTAKVKQVQKNLMRQDPDVALIGEVRDLDTAKILIDLATTGHLAFATMHTNSTLDIMTRLNDMGVSWERMATPGLLSVLIAQRLVPKLCDYCKIGIENVSKEHEINHINKAHAKKRIDTFVVDKCSEYKIYTQNPSGCKQCRKGINGRLAVLEIIKVDKQGCKIIRSGDMNLYHDYLLDSGWESMLEHGVHLIQKGLLDPYLVDGIIGEIGNSGDNDRFDYQNARSQIASQYSKPTTRTVVNRVTSLDVSEQTA